MNAAWLPIIPRKVVPWIIRVERVGGGGCPCIPSSRIDMVFVPDGVIDAILVVGLLRLLVLIG